MVTCKDCVHVEVCETFSLLSESFEIASPERIANDCEHFKHQSRFVELPYDLEQTVFVLDFVIDKEHRQKYQIVKEAFIHSYSYAKQYGKVISLMIKEDEIKSTFKSYKLTDFGKTVFLTREEAEQALKD